MNTAAQTFVIAVASVAAAAAIGVALGNRTAATPAADVVKLERVVIVGKRADAQATVVAQLPRVVIEGRRTVDIAQAAVAPTL